MKTFTYTDTAALVVGDLIPYLFPHTTRHRCQNTGLMISLGKVNVFIKRLNRDHFIFFGVMFHFMVPLPLLLCFFLTCKINIFESLPWIFFIH